MIYRWDTWSRNCTKTDPHTTFVPKFIVYTTALMMVALQVLQHHSLWDDGAGVGIPRRDRKTAFIHPRVGMTS